MQSKRLYFAPLQHLNPGYLSGVSSRRRLLIHTHILTTMTLYPSLRGSSPYIFRDLPAGFSSSSDILFPTRSIQSKRVRSFMAWLALWCWIILSIPVTEFCTEFIGQIQITTTIKPFLWLKGLCQVIQDIDGDTAKFGFYCCFCILLHDA